MKASKLSSKRNRSNRKPKKISDSAEANLTLGRLLLSEGKAEEARPYLEKAVRSSPDDLDVRRSLASAYASLGLHNQAEAELRQIIRQDSQCAQAYCALAEIRLAVGDAEEAIENYRKALFIKKEEPRIHNDLGAVLYATDRFADAERHLRTALTLKPDYPDATHNMAMLYLQQGKAEQSKGLLERLIEIEPDRFETRQQLGLLKLKLGDFAGAKVHLLAASQLMPDGIEPRYWLGIAHYGTNELDAAIELFEWCIERDNTYYPASCALAACFMKAGKQAEAIKMWDRVLAVPAMSPAQPLRHSAPLINPFEIVQLTDRASKDTGLTNTVELSVVIPVCNEEANIRPLWEKLKPVLMKIGRSHEVIFIDDGSTDETLYRLRELSASESAIKIISFRRNYGQTAALSAAFDCALGEIVVTMDGDLQNDPADIPMLLEKLAEGYDLVSGWRRDRKDKFLSRKLPSMIANRLIAKITGVRLHDYGCSLKAYKKGIVKNIRLYGEMHRFIPAVVSWLGAKIIEVPVRHHPRIHGQTKYGISRTTRVILDLINVKFLMSYLTRPMQYFGKLGVMSIGAAFVSAVGLSVVSVLSPHLFSTNAILLATLLFTLVGVQFLTIGLLAEIVIRTYHESQQRPIYVVKELIEGPQGEGAS